MTVRPDLNRKILVYAYMLDIIINIIHFYSQKCFDLSDNYMFILSWEQMDKCGCERKVEFK